MSTVAVPRPGNRIGRPRPPAILIVLRSLEVGGSQRQSILLDGELRDAFGARVAIWTLERGEALAAELAEAGIEWESHPLLPSRRGPGKIPALIKLTRSIHRWRPEAILSFNDFPNKVCGAIWPWTGAKACVWNQRDGGLEVTGRFLERQALKRVRIFAANSSQGAAFLTGQFGIPDSRIRIIPNGVQLAPPKRARGKWRSELELTEQAIVVTMVANLHHCKDHQTLLAAWARLRMRPAAQVHLVLAGRPDDTAGQLKDLCRRLQLEASVHFIGLTDEVAGLLGASDIVVYSSKLEGMPNAILEGMSAGLPVTATRIAGSEEALGSDYPFLVPPNDAEALADALRTLIGNAPLRHKVGQQNHERARSQFSVAKLGQRYMDMLTPFLPSHRDNP